MNKNQIASLIKKLEEVKLNFHVTAMPDFFIDHFIIYPNSINQLIEDLKSVAKRKGGNIFKGRQFLLRGGCAANFAAALGRLGVKTTLIAETNQLGFAILKFFSENVDLSKVKVGDSQALTTALEVKLDNEKVNIMFSHPGPGRNFGPEKLTNEDYEVILNSDFVAIFSWNMNNKGTQLIDNVFSRVKESGKGKTYLDIGDPTSKKQELKILINKILKKDLVDAFGVNENELKQICEALNIKQSKQDLQTLLRKLSSEVNFRIDLHTTSFSATATNGKITITPTFKVKVLRTTGAGDAWNAGNIYGWGIKLNDKERLITANALAAYYISNKKPIHPNINQLKSFLNQQLNQMKTSS
ncbi:MAG: PfkB family carbohydrate kinase [archaeon GB-1867-035]|nr:PfkB family carbohydrate kinase [Candidatus Culexmicrobium profundum]